MFKKYRDGNNVKTPRYLIALDTETTNDKTHDLAFTYSVQYVIDTLPFDVKNPGFDKREIFCDTIADNPNVWYGFIKKLSECVKRCVIVNGDKHEIGKHIYVFSHNMTFDVLQMTKSPMWDSFLEFMDSFGFTPTYGCKSSLKVFMIDIGPVHFRDSLALSGQSLESLGKMLGVEKAVGSWDYEKFRDVSTTLTDEERHYATQDCIVVLEYIRSELRNTTGGFSWDKVSELITATSALNYDMRRRAMRDKYSSRFVEYYDRDAESEYNTGCPAWDGTRHCMRGGYTFFNADYVGKIVDAVPVDATSMHPSQGCTHFYPSPSQWEEIPAVDLPISVHFIPHDKIDEKISEIVTNWVQPFKTAYHVAILVEGLQAKPCFNPSLMPIRCSNFAIVSDMTKCGTAVTSCSSGLLYVTEIELEILRICYVWNSLKIIEGYRNDRFRVPPLFALFEFASAYTAKNAWKTVRKWDKNKHIPTSAEIEYLNASLSKELADEAVTSLKNGWSSEYRSSEVYQHMKAQLNGIYGSQVKDVSKYKSWDLDDDTRLPNATEDKPGKYKNQWLFGCRIVGWSRLQQLVGICLLRNGVKYGDNIPNGDTDSLKVVGLSQSEIMSRLSPLSSAIDRSLKTVYDELPEESHKFIRTLDMIGCGRYVIDDMPDNVETERLIVITTKSYCVNQGSGWEVVCKGLPRKTARICAKALDASDDPATLARYMFGINTLYDASAANLLAHRYPKDRIYKIEGEKYGAAPYLYPTDYHLIKAGTPSEYWYEVSVDDIPHDTIVSIKDGIFTVENEEGFRYEYPISG